MSLRPEVTTITVASAGTPEQCVASETFTPFIYFEAHKDNTGDIYIGADDVDGTTYVACLEARRGVSVGTDWFGRANGEKLDLSTFWVDADTNGDKVNVTYLKRQNTK